jgi:hypothetical protein
MPKTDGIKPVKSTNPKWLDTARLFYADSFGALRLRELRGAREDWSDLTEEEQTFALAHLQYLDLMAQAGTQRLLVQISDALEEIIDALATFREAPMEADGDEDDEGFNEDFDAENGDPEGENELPPVIQPPFTHPVPRARPLPVAHLEADPNEGLADSDGDAPEDGGGRVA